MSDFEMLSLVLMILSEGVKFSVSMGKNLL